MTGPITCGVVLASVVGVAGVVVGSGVGVADVVVGPRVGVVVAVGLVVLVHVGILRTLLWPSSSGSVALPVGEVLKAARKYRMNFQRRRGSIE